MAGATTDLKSGFWLGLGLVGAFFIVGLLQVLTLRAVQRNG